MKRIAKIIAWVVGALLLLFIGAVVALTLLVNPNDYKPQIEQLAKDSTGRDLRIDGKIGLSFFPWLGLEFHQVSLSNAPGFGPEPFARIEMAGLKVKLLPLLQRKVQVDRVILDGLNLKLARNRQGRTNWEDLAKSQAEAPEKAPTPGAKKPGITGFEVAGVDVKRTQLVWRDATSGTSYTLQDLALTTGVLRPATPTPIKLDFDFTSGNPPLRSHVSLRTKAALDLRRQKLDIADLVLELAGLTVKGEVKGEKILDAPVFAGRIDIPTFNVRELLAKLGTRVATHDPKALGSASLNAKFQATSGSVLLPELTATLDQSKLSGRLELPKLTPAAYRFDLRLDQFDLDRYLTPDQAPSGKAKKQAAAPPGPAGDPFAPLRGLDADGRFRVNQFKAFGLKTSDTLIAIQAKNDNIVISPIQTKLYSGSLQGGATLNLRETPTMTVEQQVKDVQIEPLLRDAQVFEKFAGAANIDAKLSMRGQDTNQWLKTLNGTAAVEIKNGVLHGVDLARMAKDIDGAVRERRLEALGNLVPRSADKTPFDALHMTARINSGVATSDDLAVEAAGLKVSGKGSANLPLESLDYVLYVNQLPVNVTGPFASLRFKPDWNAIARSSAEKRLAEEKEKLKGREDEARKKLKEKLDERLKGLLKK